MSRDGDFATAWLKNPLKPMGPLVINSENGSGNDCDAFEFCAQQSSVPKSVLQQLGSSFLLRTTAWEMYGRCGLMISHYSVILCVFIFPFFLLGLSPNLKYFLGSDNSF